MHQVVIPVLDQTGDEVVLTAWLKREGDAVAVGEVICEVETAKAQVDIEAEAAGVLRKQLVEAGTPIPLHTVIALIGEADEPLPDVDPLVRARPAAPAPSVAAPPAAEAPSERRARIMVSPRARRLAAEHGIELATLRGSAPDGSIVEGDVRQAIERASGAATPGGRPRQSLSRSPGRLSPISGSAIPSISRGSPSVRRLTAQRLPTPIISPSRLSGRCARFPGSTATGATTALGSPAIFISGSWSRPSAVC